MEDPFSIKTERYVVQKETWPRIGCQIVAQYTEDAVLVYQAFKRSIADYAVQHQKFEGCPEYNCTRMTWVKTNFLWMMYRSNWGKKKNQEAVLGIWLKREAFDRILENVRVVVNKNDSKKNQSIIPKGERRDYGIVRLQWDPDHTPTGTPIKNRRAIQLGLKNVKSFSSGEDILRIVDMTPFVAEQYKYLSSPDLLTPLEKVYPLSKSLSNTILID
uniref:DUF4291 domain-containing protein n=1 Tax=Arcella intermedia TaxID=1963864 RepID=A0A6B2LHR4_9EUKA